jgi:DNA-binding transcriptional MerR regulator
MAQEYRLISEVARELACSTSNVRLLAESGKLPVIRTATGVRLFADADVRKLAAERRIERAAKQ